MNTQEVIAQLSKMRRDLAMQLNTLTHAIVGLGGTPEMLEIYFPEKDAPAPLEERIDVPIPKAQYPPDCGVHEHSLWKDKILFALKEIQSGYVTDIAEVIHKYEPAKRVDDLTKSISFQTSIMSGDKIIVATKEGKKNRYSLPVPES